jgi:penicillin-binding protein 1A
VITQGTGAGYTSIGCTSEAGKTGTSEGLSDAWFVGYTPKFSTAVWVGHPQSREYTGFGGPTAGPIWQSYMSAAAEGECPEFEVPEELPELSPFTGGHTTSYQSSSSNEFEASEEESEEKKKKNGKGEAAEEEPEEAAPEPTPTPPPPPAPHGPPSVGGGISPG